MALLVQYGNGIVGPIQIDGPASLPYDIDLGPLLLSDYYYKAADEIAFVGGAPPASDNVLINGSQSNPTTGVGSFHNISFTPGKRHRLRIINTSVENHFQVSISNHTMTIIEADLVPVNAFTTDSLFVGIGQRYDVTVDASQAIDNYWLNITFGGSNLCGRSNNLNPAAIIRYENASNSNPTYSGVTPIDHQCLDLLDLTPVVTRTVPTTGFTPSANNSLDVGFSLTTGKWTINSSSLVVDWEIPLSEIIIDDKTDWLPSNNVWQIEQANTWAFYLIQNDPVVPLPHPIHLHGHDFVVLGRSPDSTAAAPTLYNFTSSDISSLTVNNPVRRDVTMLPAGGWIVIAFQTDNPGQWLMHCHIAWHVAGGLGVTFLERPSDFRASVKQADIDVLKDQCSAWNQYYPSDIYQQYDSGV
ncbi:laccase, multicopper oxidase, benzenediol:oxygen oxidorectuctase [Gnomoniopsis smithogilvyi]|uniref:laccase n=1 Tax=Gnomoniopsis smithogilvyi TaxID=1191159 RepID=A0A9W8YU47_9PEZI|nr:laccase, multicopper oxidase, benzenediol:oxygen oxidorectuctase [Gnomoniopsis smithogilvyi]